MTQSSYDKLVSKLLESSNQIHNSSKSVGNYIVTSSSVAESINDVLQESEKRKRRDKKINKLLKNIFNE